MYEFGTIVLVPFPFTDLSSSKVRPALIISQDNHPGDDIVVCFITSKMDGNESTQLELDSNKHTGLKIKSSVRFDKIATLEKRIILGELGKVEKKYLRKNKEKFSRVFGFDG